MKNKTEILSCEAIASLIIKKNRIFMSIDQFAKLSRIGITNFSSTSIYLHVAQSL